MQNNKSTLEQKRNFVLVCIVPLLILVIEIILVWYSSFEAGGLTSKNSLTVVDAYSTEKIIIPVKMINGIDVPSRQVFESKLSTAELCKLANDYDSSVNYKLYENGAYLYKTKDNKIIARATLYKTEEYCELNYIFENMYVEGIVFPKFLVTQCFDKQITFNNVQYEFYAIGDISITQMANWLSSTNNYNLQVIETENKIISTYKDTQTEIYFESKFIAVRMLANNTEN